MTLGQYLVILEDMKDVLATSGSKMKKYEGRTPCFKSQWMKSQWMNYGRHRTNNLPSVIDGTFTYFTAVQVQVDRDARDRRKLADCE